MGREPALYFGMFVSAVVVEDDMDGQSWINGGFEAVEETQELLMTVSRLTLPYDGSVQYVQRGEQGGSSMPLIVMGLSLR